MKKQSRTNRSQATKLVPPSRKERRRLTAEAQTLMERGRWGGARRLLLRALALQPNDHWLLASISMCFCGEGRKSEALRWSNRALGQSPNCPYALSEHADNLARAGRDGDARQIYDSLLRSDLYALAFGECGEGERFALLLRNDCRWELARIANNAREFTRSKRLLRDYIARRQAGEPGYRSLADARRKLAEVIEYEQRVQRRRARQSRR